MRSDPSGRWWTSPPFMIGVAVGVGVTAVVAALVVIVNGGDDDVVGSEQAALVEDVPPTPGPEERPDPTIEEETDVDPPTTTTTEAPTVPGSAAERQPLPSGEPVACPTATRTVGSAEELQAALDDAAPGDVIELADGTYAGKFVMRQSGTDRDPIHVCGGRGAVIDGEGVKKGYALHLDHVAFVRLSGFTVRNSQKGVMADGLTDSTIHGLLVEEIGDEAIHLRSASSHNSVVDNTVRRTGLRRDKFGEGIYIGSATSNWEKYSGGEPDRSDANLVQGNTISETTSEAVDIKEGTTGGKLVDNTFDGTGMSAADSLIDVKGNDWLIEGNTGTHAPTEGFQTHRILDGWGTGNVFRSNSVGVDGGGLHFYIHDPNDTANTVACDNRSDTGGPVRANVDCA